MKYKDFLLALALAGSGGGSGGGDYANLSNLPQINGVTLSGDKTAADLGLAEVLFESGTGSDSVQQILPNHSGPNEASGDCSVALGQHTTASGDGAVALGSATTASGLCSFAMGVKSASTGTDVYTVASGNQSVAMGIGVNAGGNSSQAFGQRTKTTAPMSSAFGNYTIASGRACFVAGQYNVEDTNPVDTTHGGSARKYVAIIGNGTAENARSNALTVDWDGNVVAAGKITVGTAPSANSDVATKQYVDENSGKVTEVTNSSTGAVSLALDAGKIYHFTGALTALTITLNAPASGQLAHYRFDFNSGSTAPTVTIPNTVTMPSGFTVEASKYYEIDILNGYGAVMAW